MKTDLIPDKDIIVAYKDTATICLDTVKTDEPRVTREEEAKMALEHTLVTPVTTWVLFLAFILIVMTVPVLQHVVEIRQNLPIKRQMRSSMRRGALLPACEVVTPLTSLHELLRVQNLRNAAAILPVHGELKRYEAKLENSSVVANWMLPRSQYVLTRFFSMGNEQSYCGRSGWLFYRPDVEYITNRGFMEQDGSKTKYLSLQSDPVKAIVNLKEQLSERGITLILMPIPSKPMIYPEELSRHCAKTSSALDNRSYAMFLQMLRQRGIVIYDPTSDLMTAKLQTGLPQYLETDTHWTPVAMESCGKTLAKLVHSKVRLSRYKMMSYTVRPLETSNRGDIDVMLGLAMSNDVYRPQQVKIHQIYGPDRQLWTADHSAEILLLGDSFTNVYSLAGMGWGTGAGLAENLSYYLGEPVDRIAVNAGGSCSTIERLVTEMKTDANRLAGKKVIIYEFAKRDLLTSDWKCIYLPEQRNIAEPDNHTRIEKTGMSNLLPAKVANEPGSSIVNRQISSLAPGIAQATQHYGAKPQNADLTTLHVPGSEMLEVEGTIAERADAPRPGTQPYKDCLIAIHLINVKVIRGCLDQSAILILVWGMRDNKLTELAKCPDGSVVRLRLKPWADVEKVYGSYNRCELDDDSVLELQTFWGEDREN